MHLWIKVRILYYFKSTYFLGILQPFINKILAIVASKRNSRQESYAKGGRESSLLRRSQLNNSSMRPGSSHVARNNIPETLTPPGKYNSSKKNKRGNLKISSNHGFYAYKHPHKVDTFNNKYAFSGKITFHSKFVN